MVYALGRILHTYEHGIEYIHMVEPECHGSGYDMFVCVWKWEWRNAILYDYAKLLYCIEINVIKGVHCYIFIQTRYMNGKLHLITWISLKWSESCSIVSDSLWPHGLDSPWNSPGQNTGVGSLSLLQGIFPTQGSNPGLPHCRQILYQLSCKGSPRILEWVACPFSSRSSWPRNPTGVSCIAGIFFTNWAIRESLLWYGQRSLACCSPWGHKELDVT